MPGRARARRCWPATRRGCPRVLDALGGWLLRWNAATRAEHELAARRARALAARARPHGSAPTPRALAAPLRGRPRPARRRPPRPHDGQRAAGRRRALGVVDWEHADAAWLPFTDLAYAAVDAIAVARRLPRAEALAALRRDPPASAWREHRAAFGAERRGARPPRLLPAPRRQRARRARRRRRAVRRHRPRAAPRRGRMTRVLALTPYPPRSDGRHGGSRAMAASLLALAGARARPAVPPPRPASPRRTRRSPAAPRSPSPSRIPTGRPAAPPSSAPAPASSRGALTGTPAWVRWTRLPAVAREAPRRSPPRSARTSSSSSST